MNRRILLHSILRVATALALPAATAAHAAACIEVTASSYEAGPADLGVVAVQWSAELANGCSASYDADLTIRFVDEHGADVYLSHDLISVARHGVAVARREFNIPVHDFERVLDVQVRVGAERERPF
jgi:hypothetical protein